MARIRELEIIAAKAVLKAVSSRYAPGTQDRILKFLADQGAVASVIAQYDYENDLEKACLTYWNALLEPDALRLEDLTSAILISFATSFAASLIIEGGKSGFPVLYRRIVKSSSIDRTLHDSSSLEHRRRGHIKSILNLLNRKAEAIKSLQSELNDDLRQIRSHIANGGLLRDVPGNLAEEVDLTPIESVVRGFMLTEEQRESGFDLGLASTAQVTALGLPLSTFFGAGQIIHSRIDALISSASCTYESMVDFKCDLQLPLSNIHKHTALRKILGKPPKKIIPVADHDLGRLINEPQQFLECRQLIGGLVLRWGGMTSHTAVLSRALGIPAIQLNGKDFVKLKEYQFGAIQSGTALLWKSSPPDEFHKYI